MEVTFSCHQLPGLHVVHLVGGVLATFHLLVMPFNFLSGNSQNHVQLSLCAAPWLQCKYCGIASGYQAQMKSLSKVIYLFIGLEKGIPTVQPHWPQWVECGWFRTSRYVRDEVLNARAAILHWPDCLIHLDFRWSPEWARIKDPSALANCHGDRKRISKLLVLKNNPQTVLPFSFPLPGMYINTWLLRLSDRALRNQSSNFLKRFVSYPSGLERVFEATFFLLDFRSLFFTGAFFAGFCYKACMVLCFFPKCFWSPTWLAHSVTWLVCAAV